MAESLSGLMRQHIGETWADRPFGKSVSQIAAASVLKDLSVTTPEASDWESSEPNVHLRATTLSYLTATLSEDVDAKPLALDYVAPNALRLARLWESLASLNEKAPRGHALLNAACAYELAGYQANAACLSRRFESERQSGTGADLQQAVSMFLQRRFVELRRTCALLTAEPDYDKVDDMAYTLGQAGAALALSRLGGLFLSGGEGAAAGTADSARKTLASAERILFSSGHHQESALLYGVRALVAPMMSRSTWSVLGDRAGASFAWRRYLMLLARGLGDNLPASRSVSEMWPSQREAVEKGLLDSNASKVVSMPTSSGKTRIAEMSILHALTSAAGSKCVYIAPYRALVSEVVESLARVFPDLGYSVSGVDGSYDDDPSEGDLAAGADILVMTPEKLDLMARVHADRLGRVGLFVLDEGHVIGDSRRGLKVELLVTRLRRRFANSRMIVLSAMISDRAMRELAGWLCGRGDNAIRTGWRPTLQRHAMFEWLGGGSACMLTYERDANGDRLLPEIRAQDIIRRARYEHVDARGRTLRPSFPSANKSETAAELAFKYSSLGPVLVYATTKRSVMSVAKKLLRRIELTEKSRNDMPEHFRHRQFGETTRSLRAAREWLGPDHDMARLLERGIAVHHGGVPDALRQSIESDLRDHKYSAVVATNTLSQGVNIPIRTVVVHSCRRYDEQTGAYGRIPASEYWNLGGRAGRAGRETEGTVVHLVLTPLDRADYDYYRRSRGDMSDVDGRLYALLRGLADKRITAEDIDSAIDPEVLGMLAEEGIEGSCEDMVGDVVSGTLAASKAAAGGDDIGAVCSRFQAVARSASLLGPRLVGAYGGTGLGSHSCEAVRSRIAGNPQEVARLLHSESDDDLAALVLEVLDTIEELPEMAGDYQYDGDREALVRAWLGGASVSEAFEAAGAGSRDDHARFIERILGGRAPWGIAAFLRIAGAVDCLDAERLPPKVANLSEMVRHGVPNPRAGWAMRLGVPSKAAAIKMAADCPGAGSLGGFAQWLAGLGVDELDRRYGLGSDSAGVARAVSRTRPNPLVRRGLALDDVLAMGADVRCVPHGDGPSVAARAPIGSPLTIKRAYSEPDRNAIAVYAEGSLVGYVEPDMAQYLAPLIDCGTDLSARRADGAREGGSGGGPATVRILMQRDEAAARAAPAADAPAEFNGGGISVASA